MARKIITSTALLLFFSGLLSAQNLTINYNNPTASDGLIVCDSAVFDISLSNNSVTVAVNIQLSIQFPPGVFYNVGSIVNANPLDLSNLNAPVFTLEDILPNQSQNISLSARADCSLIDDINNMELFSNNIHVSYTGGSNTVMTTPYNIETPLLVLANSGATIQSGVQGDVLTRSFTITNTRLGPLHSFTFIDNHEGGIEISANIGTNVSGSGNSFELFLDGDDFMTIGDGDELLELNESITITEEILITSCGEPISSSFSNISATWGCDGAICQTTTSLEAYIDIETTTLQPLLTFTPIAEEVPQCYCTGDAIQHGLIITNNSITPAINIEIYLDELNGFAGIAQSSFYVDSNGIITPIPDVTVNDLQFFSDGCNIPFSVYRKASLTIPLILGPGESMTLYWNTYVCTLACNTPHNKPWAYSYIYDSPCPAIINIMGQDSITHVGPTIGSMLENTILEPPADGDTINLNYTLFSSELLNNGEELTLVFEIPCGLSLPSEDELVIGGQNATSYNINPTDTITYITTTYSLPFSSDTIELNFDLVLNCTNICEDLICRDTVITSCTEYCGTDSSPGLVVSINSFLQMVENCPEACNLNTCVEETITPDCEIPLCEEYIPGYADYTFSAFRVNYGLPDNDNDRIADGSGVIDYELVRRDRAIAGDTVQVNVNSVVVIDEIGYSFPAGQLLVKIMGSDLFETVNATLFETGSLLPISQDLTIFDNSSNSYYQCGENMPITINTIDNPNNVGGFSFQFDISPEVITGGLCSLPSDFEYEEGDSILFSQQFKINYNLVPEVPGETTPPVSNISISPEVYLLDENSNIPTEDWFTCNCSSAQMQLSGYRYNISSGIHAVPGCDTSKFVGGSLFSFLLGMGNFFPYEHRSLGQLSDWQIELPNGFSIVNSKLTFLQLQPGVPLFSEVPIPFVNNNNRYQYDLLPFQTPHLDEGFTLLIQSSFEADCSLTGNYPLIIHAEISPAPNLLLPSMIDTSVIRQAALRMLVPDLELSATFFNNVSYNDRAQWNFNLTNNATSVASFTSGDAENVWVRPYSASGLVTDFELTNTTTAVLFPQINGIFQLGNLDSLSTINLKLEAQNHSCSEEEIILYYGWNCSPYNNSIANSCNQQDTLFSVLSPPAFLEQTVESPLGTHFLCDTIGYHTITVFNANLGTAYQTTLSTQLPSGLYIIPGSCEISYPYNSTFTPIPDPVNTGTGTWIWDVAALEDSIGINGLPGFIFSPDNSYQIRFKLYTDCEFIAGSFPIFFAAAEQVCAEPTNTLAEAGNPIEIDGLPAPYDASISVQSSVPVISCQDSVSFSINVSANANTILGDSIFITLPAGISYVANSVIGNENAVESEPVLDSNNNLQILKWPLLEGVIAGEPITFSLELTGFSDLDCGNPIILIQTVGPASALCTSNNSICDILIETGSNVIQLEIDRPSFDLTDFEISLIPDGINTDLLNYNLLIHNNGFTASPPIILDFYLDTDNSGDWTPSDLFIHSDSNNNNITNGSSISLSGSFVIANGQACAVIAVIDPQKQCACLGDEQIINTTIAYQYPEAFILCSGVNQSIGISGTPAASYQWTPNTGLTCSNCPTTEVTLSNNSNNTNTLIYTLLENDGSDCISSYEFTLDVQPQAGINNSNESICPGDSILLEATAANSYFWTGPGISNPSLSSQWVSPTTNTLYTVLLTDAFGCNGMDSIWVNLTELPVAFAGNDSVYCENSIVQLQAFFDPTYTYQWSPTNLLDNPNSANPNIITNVSTTYTLVVTNGAGCESSDQVLVNFSEAPVLIGETEAAICPGDSIELSFSGALNYQWSPATGLSCDTCASTFASPEESTTYILTGSDANACNTSISVNVNLLEVVAVESSAFLCEGDSIILFGQFVSEPGMYCDTIVNQFTGCDSVHCVILSLHPEVYTEESRIICEGESIEIDGVIYNEAGTYCSLMQTFAGCDSTHCLLLEVTSTPVVELLSEVSIVLGDTVALGPLPEGYSYNWSPSVGLSCTDCPNPLAFPSTDIIYQVIITDTMGCQNDYEVVVRTTTPVCEPPYIFMPNAFTPNGDNENDVLKVYGNGIVRLHLVIFNRWGEKVFETFEVNGFWDGTYKGKNLGPDVFGYYLELDCIGGESYSHKGNVTILK